MTSPSTLQSKKRQRESEEGTTTTISSFPLQSKDRPRESEEADKSTSGKVSKASSSSSVKKATVTTVSRSTSGKENEKHVSQSESEVTNSVVSGKRGTVLKREGIRGRGSLASQLIMNRVLVSGTTVFCCGSNNVIKRGSISCEGIVCDCCSVNFTVTKFEAHAGCTKHRPSISIFLEDGRSLLDCKREARSSANQKGNDCNAEAKSEAANRCVAEENSQENNDTCSVCGFGGHIILCEGCPSSFHTVCLGLSGVPDGNWYCSTCCCRICLQPTCKQVFANDKDNNILACVQCEHKVHFGCVKATPCHIIKKNCFCSEDCANMFLSVKNNVLGKPIKVAKDLTWTLLKNNVSCDGELSQKKRKLNEALGVLHESFDETIDPLSGRDLIKDIVFSRYSKNKRLNFRGFYIVILEEMGKVISVATVRIYRQKVAEMVFMATKKQYRRQGMCSLLMKGLEKELTDLGVGSLVLHSSKDALKTWTNAFHFAMMTDKDKCKFSDYTFFEFHDTIMCLKPLPQKSALSH